MLRFRHIFKLQNVVCNIFTQVYSIKFSEIEVNWSSENEMFWILKIWNSEFKLKILENSEIEFNWNITKGETEIKRKFMDKKRHGETTLKK